MGKPRGRKRAEDTEFVVFGGITYTRRPGKRYFKTNRWDKVQKKYVPDSLHRAVWRFHHGSIPDGYDVHHKDGDWNNNEVDNLECISRAEHNREHDSFKEWNARPEAEEHRKRNRKKFWDEHTVFHERTCVVCGAKFRTRHVDPGRVIYCSALCRGRAGHARRKNSGL